MKRLTLCLVLLWPLWALAQEEDSTFQTERVRTLHEVLVKAQGVGLHQIQQRAHASGRVNAHDDVDVILCGIVASHGSLSFVFVVFY